MKPPSSAPAMPRSVVTMNPPGSFPGVSSLAMIPTTTPNTIHDKIPMSALLRLMASTASVSPRQTRGRPRAALPGGVLVVEQPPLALEAAAVTSEAAVGSDDAVARHHERDRVR